MGIHEEMQLLWLNNYSAIFRSGPELHNWLRSGTLTVTPAILTVTALSQPKSMTRPIRRSPTQLQAVNGDTSKVAKGSPSLSTTAMPLSPIDTYPISIAQGTLSPNNYTFAFVNGVLSVTRANTTTTTANVTVKTGAASATLTATITALSPSTAIVNEGTVTFVVKNISGTVLQTVTSGNGCQRHRRRHAEYLQTGSGNIFDRRDLQSRHRF